MAKVDSEDKPKSADAIASAFTPEEWEPIRAELPANHRAVLAALAELRSHARICLVQIPEQRSERREVFMAERERWGEAVKLALHLIEIFNGTHLPSSPDAPSPLPSPSPDADLPHILALHGIHQLALLRHANADAMIGGNSGTKDSFRAMIYADVLRIWTDVAGGKLEYSRQANGTPDGPLIRFLSAAVPLMLPPGTPRLSPHSFRTIVDNTREHTRVERARLPKLYE